MNLSEEIEMRISTGQPSTLATYRKIAAVMFPKALPMLDARIEQFGVLR